MPDADALRRRPRACTAQALRDARHRCAAHLSPVRGRRLAAQPRPDRRARSVEDRQRPHPGPDAAHSRVVQGSLDPRLARVRGQPGTLRPSDPGLVGGRYALPPGPRELAGVCEDLGREAAHASHGNRRRLPGGPRRHVARLRGRRARRRAPRRRQDAGARSVHHRSHRARAQRRDRPGARPRLRDPPVRRHPHATPAEQSDPHRRGRRRQDRRRRRASRCASPPATCRRRCRNVVGPHARSGPAAGRRGREGRVREPPQVGDRRGQGLAAADHPVHRRGAHHDRRRRPGRTRATRPTCSSRRWRAASCGRSRQRRGRNTRSTSRRTPRWRAASRWSRSRNRARRKPSR